MFIKMIVLEILLETDILPNQDSFFQWIFFWMLMFVIRVNKHPKLNQKSASVFSIKINLAVQIELHQIFETNAKYAK